MPHAMTEAFTVEETGTEASTPQPAPGSRAGKRQQDAANACACPAAPAGAQHAGTCAKDSRPA